MKRMIWQAGVVVFLMAGSVWDSHAQRIPSGTKTDTFPAAAAISLDVGGVTNCAILLTGSGSIKRSDYLNDKTNVTLQTELVSLDLVGFSPAVGAVRLLAGSNLVGRASTGVISGTSQTNFPATSFFDTFLIVQLPGGTNLLNQSPVVLQADITRVPPISQIYTNRNQVPLVNAANSNQVVAQLVQMWFSPAAKGQDSELGVSLNVFGTNTLGTVSMLVCPSNSEVAAIAQLHYSNYTGVITPNPGCDEVAETNLQFAAAWDSELRAPGWQGGHKGNWIMYTLATNGRTNLFAFGTMMGSNGVGTHRAPLSVNAEDCNSCQHFEGGLTGHIIAKGSLANAEINASYAGDHLDPFGNPIGCCPPPPGPPTGFFQMTIDGVVITKCLAP